MIQIEKHCTLKLSIRKKYLQEKRQIIVCKCCGKDSIMMVKTAYDRVAVEKVCTYTRILLFSSTLPILIQCQKEREITAEQIHG